MPAVRVRELASAASSGAHTIDTIDYADQGEAISDLRNGRVNGVLTIPTDFSRRVLAKNEPRVALIEDNTDGFVSVAMAGTLGGILQAYSLPSRGPRISSVTSLDVVEIYPYVPYIQYLLPGSVVMSIFMMVMIGGGIIFIDDKARGLHEGYLVTPITKLELVAGFNVAGTIKSESAATRARRHRPVSRPRPRARSPGPCARSAASSLPAAARGSAWCVLPRSCRTRSRRDRRPPATRADPGSSQTARLRFEKPGSPVTSRSR
jgi:hypothetical protein